jgi:hypothetical protein
MTKSKKYKIEVRLKGKRYGEPGELIEIIQRAPWCEAIGNFNPMFCRYKGKRELVQSLAGDISDPFRRDETYLKTLYIEVAADPDISISNAAAAMGRIGGKSRSELKQKSVRANGLLGGRPRKPKEVAA